MGVLGVDSAYLDRSKSIRTHSVEKKGEMMLSFSSLHRINCVFSILLIYLEVEM